MANNHYKRKDYTWLLNDLQKNSKKPKLSKFDSEISSLPEFSKFSKEIEDLGSPTVNISLLKSVQIDYDLDLVLFAVTYMDKLIKLYEDAQSQINTEQQITQDLLHAIEFADNCKEWYRLSTQLHYSRVRRRQYKNAVEVLEPVVKFLKSPDNKKCLDILRNIVGESRKIKSTLSDKTYHPRILNELGVFKNGKSIKK